MNQRYYRKLKVKLARGLSWFGQRWRQNLSKGGLRWKMIVKEASIVLDQQRDGRLGKDTPSKRPNLTILETTVSFKIFNALGR